MDILKLLMAVNVKVNTNEPKPITSYFINFNGKINIVRDDFTSSYKSALAGSWELLFEYLTHSNDDHRK